MLDILDESGLRYLRTENQSNRGWEVNSEALYQEGGMPALQQLYEMI